MRLQQFRHYLELLDITGAIITIDAMGTQTEIAKKMIDKIADYVLALKANHPTLYNQVKQWFETAVAQDFQGIDVSYDRRIEKAKSLWRRFPSTKLFKTGHHRTEIRQVWSVPISALGELYQPKIWAGLQSVVMIVREHRLWNQTTREVQFYLSSLHSDAQLLFRSSYPQTLGH